MAQYRSISEECRVMLLAAKSTAHIRNKTLTELIEVILENNRLLQIPFNQNKINDDMNGR